MHNPDMHHRRSIRLKGYNYSQYGAYFVTICTQNKKCLFGDIRNGEIVLNDAGKIAREEWIRTGEIRKNVKLDKYTVMPSHLHGIIFIVDDCCRDTARRAPTFGKSIPGSLSTIVGAFKSAVSKNINKLRNTSGSSIWQRNFYEHIIRNEKELNRIREYIINNAMKWAMDRDNPKGKPDENEKDFWRYLGMIMPDYKKRRGRLKRDGAQWQIQEL